MALPNESGAQLPTILPLSIALHIITLPLPLPTGTVGVLRLSPTPFAMLSPYTATLLTGTAPPSPTTTSPTAAKPLRKSR